MIGGSTSPELKGRKIFDQVKLYLGTTTESGHKRKEKTETARSGSNRREKLPTENNAKYKMDGRFGHDMTGKAGPNQVRIGTGTATKSGRQVEEKRTGTARSGSRLREKLPKLDYKDAEYQSKDMQSETAPECSNLAIVKEMEVNDNMTKCSMIGDKVRKRMRSGRLKYKLKDKVKEFGKEKATRRAGERRILDSDRRESAHQTEIEGEMELECGKNGNMGTTGIFDKRNWKFLQQKSNLHTTRKKTSLKPLKTKNKIRKDYAKVGKSGKTNKSVQDIVHFFEKMGGTSQSQSLTMGNVELLKTKSGSKAGTNLSQKRDVGGGAGCVGIE